MEYSEIKWDWRSIGGIGDIVGKTPIKIQVERNNDDYIAMWFDDGTVCRFYHNQDCCESVTIDDINGDFQDLIGYQLHVAEERSSHEDSGDYESVTWTFYTFRGVGGSVDVRWCGSSNGYYSESVDFDLIKVES